MYDCKNTSTNTKIHDSSTYSLNQTVNLEFETYYTKSGTTTKYYFYKTIKNGTTEYTSNKVIGASKNDVTLNVYYGLRYYMSYYIKYVVGVSNSVSYSVFDSDSVSSFWATTKSVSRSSGKGDSVYLKETNNVYRKYNFNKKVKTITYGQEKNSDGLTSKEFNILTDKNVTDTTGSIGNISSSNKKDKLDYSVVGFYYEYEPSVKVIVRHIKRTLNDNGTYSYEELDVNSEESYRASGSSVDSVISNGYSQRKANTSGTSTSELTTSEKSSLLSILKNKKENKYEIYEIDKSDILLVDRLRTILDGNGNYYKCLGYLTKTYSKTDTPAFLSNVSSGYSTGNLQVSNIGLGDNEYLFIDYYYEVTSYSDDPTSTANENSIAYGATLNFYAKSSTDAKTKLDSNGSVLDGVAYVPASENLKPYVVSDICRAKTLKYKITASNGKITYSVDSYLVWGIYTDSASNTTVGSVENIEGTEVIGNDNKNVYNSNRSLYLSNSDDIKTKVRATFSAINTDIKEIFNKNVSDSSTQIDTMLKNVKTEKTSDGTFKNSTEYNLNGTKYNGYRQTSGTIAYGEYEVTSTSSSRVTKKVTCNLDKDNSMPVNIYTPISISEKNVIVTNKNYVDHTTSEIKDKFVIQQGTKFDLTVSTNNSSYEAPYSNISATGKYVKYWYVKFNFDVKWNGNTYKAGQLLKIEASHTDQYATTVFTDIDTVANIADSGTTSDALIEHVKVYASAINIPDDSTYKTEEKIKDNSITLSKVDATNRIDVTKIKLRTKGGDSAKDDLTGMDGSAFYIVSKPRTSTSIGRIFDFEITDCLDVNFKDVFRNLNESNTVNSSTGTRYYSGIRSLLVIDGNDNTSDINVLNDRGKIQYGSILSILPLGPYKHTSNSYIGGVKLGYRISFDVKTSGYYNKDNDDGVTRTVSITPSYYYISKDGNTYNDNIVLYYKNSSGKYVKYDSSEYTIYYKPNDGYRTLASKAYTFDVASNDQDTLTDKLTGLKVSSTFELSDSKSMTTSANKFVQVWYGEYKLPNSTIAVDNTTGSIDINNPLTDGYIGVKFDIKCIDSYTTSGNKETIEISYNSNNKNATSKDNTSQWDYEGYLGFTKQNIGSALSGTLKLQLEKGVWKIDSDEMYNAIKGTVVLYDTDNRAADDYN